MRLNKLLFLVFLALYFIAGLSLLITGSVAHRQASKYAEITGHSLMSGAGFIIALGVFILLLSVLGFFAAVKNRLDLLKIFIASLALILLLQLIAVIVGFTLRNKADNQLRTRLMESLPGYKANNQDVVNEWNRLQQQWSCCGVNNYTDWTITGKLDAPPPSCCLTNPCPPANETSNGYFTSGCYEHARKIFFDYSKALGGVSLFFFFVEIAGLVLAFVVLRDLKNNYGSV